jgi:hypothetical protein
VKSALIGEVCRYYADDYIIWSHNGKADRQRILKSCRPKLDLMTQRYLFVEGAESGEKCAIRSFLFGFRGYAEVHSFTPGGRFEKRIKDLAPLVDKALELLRSRKKRVWRWCPGKIEAASVFHTLFIFSGGESSARNPVYYCHRLVCSLL